MNHLERYEWCDFWWDDPGNKSKDRVLLIGDSITRGYRPYVEEYAIGEFCVDMLATSMALDNPALLNYIKIFIGQYSLKYKVIHFNNGLHGFNIPNDRYEKHFMEILDYFQRKVDSAEIILTSSTPVWKQGGVTEVDENPNKIVIDRNAIVYQIAKKYSLNFNDLYSAMEGKMEYRLEDGFHYTEKGQKEQGRLAINIIRTII